MNKIFKKDNNRNKIKNKNENKVLKRLQKYERYKTSHGYRLRWASSKF